MIIREGDDGDMFYLVEEGTLFAEKEGVGRVKDYTKGDYFGEIALLK